MTDIDGEFERIIQDLTGQGPCVITIKLGDQVEALDYAEYESIATVVGDLLRAGGDWLEAFEPALKYSPMVQYSILNAVFQRAVLPAFHLPPMVGAEVLDRVRRFLYFKETIRPEGA